MLTTQNFCVCRLARVLKCVCDIQTHAPGAFADISRREHGGKNIGIPEFTL